MNSADPGEPGPDFERAVQWLRQSRRVAVFSGAGISAESGIPTFRDTDGLWERFPPAEYAYRPGLLRKMLFRPGRLAEFLHAVLEPIAVARPNAAHHAIARLEKHTDTTVITQNVDGLHQEAGSLRVREVHGSFYKIVSLRGRFLRRIGKVDLTRVVERLGRARRGLFKRFRLLRAVRPLVGVGLVSVRRPSLVLFGDALAEPDWTWAQQDAESCDLMLVVGTSGVVWPAGLLPQRVLGRGGRVVTIDPHDQGAGQLWLCGPAGEVLPRLVDAAFGDSTAERRT